MNELLRHSEPKTAQQRHQPSLHHQQTKPSSKAFTGSGSEGEIAVRVPRSCLFGGEPLGVKLFRRWEVIRIVVEGVDRDYKKRSLGDVIARLARSTIDKVHWRVLAHGFWNRKEGRG